MYQGGVWVGSVGDGQGHVANREEIQSRGQRLRVPPPMAAVITARRSRTNEGCPQLGLTSYLTGHLAVIPGGCPGAVRNDVDRKILPALGVIRSTVESSIASSLYAQQQEIDRIFVDNVDLQPYFWHRRELPDASAIGDPAAKQEAQQLAVRAEATAHRFLDHFAHLKYQMGTQAFTSERADWEAYIRRSFADSPALCRALRDDREAFGGTGTDTLWGWYAAKPCRGT